MTRWHHPHHTAELQPGARGGRADARQVEGATERLAGCTVIPVNRLDGVKLVLEDGGWLPLRPSETEPVIRLYADALTEPGLEAIIAEDRASIGM